jgi:regulator of replication initiation timing
MYKVKTPAGEEISIDEHADVRIQAQSAAMKALLWIYQNGAIVSEEGHAVSYLTEKLGLPVSSCSNMSSNVGNFVKRKFLIRHTRGLRTYRISMDGAVIPRKLYDWLRNEPITTRLEVVPDAPMFVAQDPPVHLVVETEPEPEPVIETNDAHPVVAVIDSFRYALDQLSAFLQTTVEPPRTVVQVQEVIVEVPSAVDTALVDQNQQLIDENQRLRSELDKLATQLRATSVTQMSVKRENTPTKPDNGPLDLRSLGVKDSRYMRLIEHAHSNGFRVSKKPGQHIQFMPPDTSKPIVMGPCTPSDTRSVDNLHANLRRSGMPRLENF